MREIKFRGYDLDANKWRYGNLVCAPEPFIAGDMVESNEKYCDLEFWWPVVSKSVGQFTGLLDKNGKEICEGDILSGFVDGNERVVMDVFAGRWCLETAKGHVSPLNSHSILSREIIGNIYEHPELLEGKGGE